MSTSNNQDPQSVTKTDLENTEKRILKTTKKWLEKFATKKDLEKFATKKDLEDFATKYDLLDLEARMEEKFVTNERFDQAMGKLDYIIGELKTVREEQTVQSLHDERISERLGRIEQVPIIAHALK